MMEANQFGEITCSVCGFNEGMPGANMVHICRDCREAMKPKPKAEEAVALSRSKDAAS